MESPDDQTQAHMAIKSTDAGKTLSWAERDQVADAIVGGKIGKLKSPQMREALVEALISLGVTTETLAKKIQDGLNADETLFFQRDGVVTDSRERIAWNARHSYLRTSLKLLGVEGGKQAVRVNAKNFVYRPVLRGAEENLPIVKPTDETLKRRMAAAKHNAREIPNEDAE